MARDLKISVTGDSASGRKALDSLADEAEKAARQVKVMEERADRAAVKARKFAEAEERAADKTREFAKATADLDAEIRRSGVATAEQAQKLEKLTRQTRTAALATDDLRRASDRAAENAREQARGYEKVGREAAEAARKVAAFGAVSALTPNGKPGKGGSIEASIFGLKRRFASGDSSVLGDLEKLYGKLDRIERIKKRIAKDNDKPGGLLGALLSVGGKGLSLGERAAGLAGLAGKGLGGLGESAAGLTGGGTGGAILAGIAIPAAAGAGTFLGAAAGGGIGLGLGAAGAGAGLAGAWLGSPDRFDELVQVMAGRFQKRFIDASANFGDELESILKNADRTLQAIPIEKILGASQGFGATLAAGAGQGTVSFATGLADALTRMQPVIDRVGPELAELGHDFGDTLRAISLGSEGGADALGDLLDVIGWTAKQAGILIFGLETLYAGIRKLAIGGAEAYRDLTPFGGLIADWAGHFLKSDTSVEHLGRSLGDTAVEAEGMGGAIAGGIGAFNEATIAADAYNDSLTQLRNTQLGMLDANLAVAQGWIDLNKELKDGARTLDTTTQEGIDNTKALGDQFGNLERQREQSIVAAKDDAAAVDAANQKYNEQVETLRQAAYAAGFNKQKVDELVQSITGIPPKTEAKVDVNGLQDAATKAFGLGAALAGFNGKTYYATIKVNQALSGINAGISSVLGHHARGGTFAAAGFKRVGEHGPEIIWGDRGEYASTAEQTRKLASMVGSSSHASGGPMSMTIAAAPAAASDPFTLATLHAFESGKVQLFVDGKRVTTRRG